MSIVSVSAKACGVHEHPHQAGHNEQRTDAASPDHGQPAEPLPQRFFFGLLNVAQGMFTGHCCDLLAIDGAVADANAGA